MLDRKARYFLSLMVLGIFLLAIGLLMLTPTYVEYACDENAKNDCHLYHVIVVALWRARDIIFDNAFLTALATIAIAYFTFTLQRSTDRLWEAGERQFMHAKETSDRQTVEIQTQLDIAKEANQAARKSADAAVATERARLYVVIEHNFLDCINYAAGRDVPTDRPVPPISQPMAGIRFHNYGKTPAIIIEVSTGIVYSETTPDPVYDVRIINSNIIASGETTDKFPTLITNRMTVRQAEGLRRGEGNIWVFGYASYDDVFGSRQVHRFFQRLVYVGPHRYVLQAYDHKHYNYST